MRHIEILVEDSSGEKLLEHLVAQLVGPSGEAITYAFHSYRGIGHLPPGLKPNTDPQKRVLLDQLPRILKGFAKTPGIDGVIVVLDLDKRDCRVFLGELQAVAVASGRPDTLFRLAIEEMEAWYLGDHEAIQSAYGHCKQQTLKSYVPDSVCDTWETLADAVFPGGRRKVGTPGNPRKGDLKHEWAERIGPFIQEERNLSPSFHKFCQGLRRVAGVV